MHASLLIDISRFVVDVTGRYEKLIVMAWTLPFGVEMREVRGGYPNPKAKEGVALPHALDGHEDALNPFNTSYAGGGEG
jgi:hypothetical protein